jgi:hypothetical protein
MVTVWQLTFHIAAYATVLKLRREILFQEGSLS